VTAPVRILIVDDDPHVRRLLRTALAREGYRTLEARSAGEAIAALQSNEPDLVLLDLGLPDADGIDVITRIRGGRSRTPIIVISGRDQQRDKINALELGANDYVTKPFAMGELEARIRVALRHEAASARKHSVIQTGPLQINLDRRVVLVDRREVHLTTHEYDLLAYLMKHLGKVVTHPRLLEELRGSAYADRRGALRVYMAQLRRKLEVDPAQPRYLLTEPGVGYRLKDDA
jgi:two-component system KDP operon response regulator KdpE